MQSTNSILMIKPTNFSYNSETAVNNYYQKTPEAGEAGRVQRDALREFNTFVNQLEERGVKVITVEDRRGSISPDSIFPNNWVSFHETGRVALYPMFAENRRLERREDILVELKRRGYQIGTIRDYSRNEINHVYLEGTGSMILDRESRKAYCAVSPRADLELLEEFCSDFDYTPIAFNSYQWVKDRRLPIYHTNVMMAVGSSFAIVCTDSIDDGTERVKVVDSLEADGKEVVYISESQVERFAGNALEVRDGNGETVIVISQSALDALEDEQIEKIERHGEILSVRIPTIERYGGGSVRCMMAEVFLPRDEGPSLRTV